MLVLSRKPNQEIHVPQHGIKFRVLGVDGQRVRIGIDAPDDVRIIRDELAFETADGLSAATNSPNYLEPCATWPLGVRFISERACRLPKHQFHNQFQVASSSRL